MHPTILAERRAVALESIRVSAMRIGAAFGVDGAILAGLDGARLDTPERALGFVEAVDGLLRELDEAMFGAIDGPRDGDDATPDPNSDLPVDAVDKVDAVDADDALESPNDLPDDVAEPDLPVVSDEPVEAGSGRRKGGKRGRGR